MPQFSWHCFSTDRRGAAKGANTDPLKLTEMTALDNSAIKKQRNGSIDALRGFAAMLVLLHHLGVLPATTEFGDAGRIGVLLFFIISGYCIFLSLDRNHYRAREFLIVRFYRLFPVYWVSIIVTIMVTPVVVDWKSVLANLTMVPGLFREDYIVPVCWTLAIEIMFYVLILFGIVASLRPTLRLMAAVCGALLAMTIAVAAARFFLGANLPFAHLLFMATFLLGGTLYGMQRNGMPSWSVALACSIFLAAVALVSFWVYHDTSNVEVRTDTYDFASYLGNFIGAVGLFYVVVFWMPIKTAVTDFFGATSYSLYLFHSAIFKAAENWFHSDTAVRAVTLTLCSIAISAAAYYFIETPFMRWGKTRIRPRQVTGISG